MCLRHSGMGVVLHDVMRLTVQACHFAFRNERWNCSLDTHYRYNILRRGKTSQRPLRHACTALYFQCSAHMLQYLYAALQTLY